MQMKHWRDLKKEEDEEAKAEKEENSTKPNRTEPNSTELQLQSDLELELELQSDSASELDEVMKCKSYAISRCCQLPVARWLLAVG